MGLMLFVMLGGCAGRWGRGKPYSGKFLTKPWKTSLEREGTHATIILAMREEEEEGEEEEGEEEAGREEGIA